MDRPVARLGIHLVTLAALISLAHGGLSAMDSEERLLKLAADAGQRESIVLIGLDHAQRISVESEGPFRVVDPGSGDAVWRPEFEGQIQVVSEGGPRGGVPSIYRIQVGAFRERSAAEAESSRLSEMTGAPGKVHHDPDRGNWRVRLGEGQDRLALGELMRQLREAGLQGLWIAEEPAQAAGDVTLRLVDERYESFASGVSRMVIVPAEGRHISIQGRAYRGIVELRVSPFGTVRPINWVALEQYLLGVVPAELGPAQWPELEALKAQAVAARTYVWRNRGQFADDGFDLCDSPRCQVYKGVGVEHPLSDRAVLATRGKVMTWKGEPIVALYTATCGGHTEDGKEIFPEHDEPYLRGVPCRAEAQGASALGSSLLGRDFEPVIDETGRDVTRSWALLAAAGVFPADPGQQAAEISGSTLGRLTASLARLSGLPPPPSRPAGERPPSLGRALSVLVEDLGWAERPRILLDPGDLPALLRDEQADDLPPEEMRTLGYLAWVEAIRPYPDGGFHADRSATGARLAPVLVRVGESYRAFALRKGLVSGVFEKELELVQGKGSIRLPIAQDAILFGRSGGNPVPQSRLPLWPGDSVAFRTNAAGAIDFLELELPVKGTADDRTARVYSWEVRRTRRQLETAINRRIAIGRLKDLESVRRGVSGRIVELRVVGSRASTVVRGFDVRRLLDLRESLLVIEIQRDAAGTIDAVVFAGKGWGHGLGLCQVGAYGMALRGADFEEILTHYYSGAKLRRIDAAKP